MHTALHDTILHDTACRRSAFATSTAASLLPLRSSRPIHNQPRPDPCQPTDTEQPEPRPSEPEPEPARTHTRHHLAVHVPFSLPSKVAVPHLTP
ncbi:hypothetical protein LZ31DRAFT_170022 [Colletotrichum somersetense]|nr:hypothetical protein LZ31DRAFT_170022 [Colletotrichum somersetense]